jgi:hypothetical protein
MASTGRQLCISLMFHCNVLFVFLCAYGLKIQATSLFPWSIISMVELGEVIAFTFEYIMFMT